jgi:hypothetical protein
LGSAVSAASVLFAVQVVRLVSDAGGDIGDAVKVVGFGVYVALVGGILVATGK